MIAGGQVNRRPLHPGDDPRVRRYVARAVFMTPTRFGWLISLGRNDMINKGPFRRQACRQILREDVPEFLNQRSVLCRDSIPILRIGFPWIIVFVNLVQVRSPQSTTALYCRCQSCPSIMPMVSGKGRT
ncbi:hypothetical protein COCOBI_19-2290 [Coccomyxa sp. Obi]|nr:hypothetical protein COCOBI_19-2290 [Coccomyxa sp. Obi]